MVRHFDKPPPRERKPIGRPRRNPGPRAKVKNPGQPLARIPLVKIVDPQHVAQVGAIRELNHAEKRQAVFDLRLQGHAMDDIAKAVGWSTPRVSQVLSQALKALHEQTRASAAELRAMEVARLDKLIIAHWPMRASVKTSELLIKILERRHKIAGLDVTHNVHTGLDGGPVQVAPALDLTKLNEEELGWLEVIVGKAGSAALVHSGMAGVDFTVGALEHGA